MKNELSPIRLVPIEMYRATRQESISLSYDSIGKHFRNDQEVDDVVEALSTINVPYMSIGLTGSRVGGIIVDTPEQLLVRLATKLHRTDIEKTILRLDNEGYVLYQTIKMLAATLRSELERVNNLGDIDLENLPQFLKNLITMKSEDVEPFYYPHDEYVPISGNVTMVGGRIIPHPAKLFPDIDIAILVPEEDEDLDAANTTSFLGQRSGTAIQLVHIQPSDLGNNFWDSNEVYEAMLNIYHPLEEYQFPRVK